MSFHWFLLLNASIKNFHLNDDDDDDSNILSIHFDNLKNLNFPIIWLRDNCQCDKCFDAVSNSKIHKPLNFTNEIIPSSINSTNDSVTIIWKDDHFSNFNKEWLCRHSFHKKHQIERLNEEYVQQISWDSNDFNKFQPEISFRFDDIIKYDDTLLKWLETLAKFGVGKISGVPLKNGQLQKLAERVSFIRKTYYGEEFFIKGDNDANNVAYKKGPLQMHTDLPYYHYAPGVVLLHCILQSTEGGENILVDGLNLVKQLPKSSYEVLTKTIVDWSDVGCENKYEFCTKNRAPVICVDDLGNVNRINWSQPQRDSVFNVSPEVALEWYKGYKKFMEMINDTKNAVIFKNEEGISFSFSKKIKQFYLYFDFLNVF
ncbi:gamma-butyrobetaine dioxygenase, putative [Pediculus humanus corporis]|uniref:Gamma-butyrobetaine dioxygenase, putative n=1 Tax=Pediculus humanus subsp. corporis TaxID=121224 RepID=E0VWB2_PEDHC|nr:gamma-butyrobetaine dioxygenase, putative [Pediculus humanus corporis]EEB17668.1 gamma-butyrobetaine dioxygenase, putative [Pediculus humanus corporis]